MMFFGTRLNAVPWCYAPEIIPLQARAKGTSLAVCWNWIFVSTYALPPDPSRRAARPHPYPAPASH
ncbi:MFS transporter [Candidatus Bathyarchaeota archaeon]|nr:MFS transporter [Candidatus Bathyarchaeota archaeon]